MPSTDTKLEVTAKASMAQPVSQPAVYANGLIMLYSCQLEETASAQLSFQKMKNGKM
jgi:hypothetical protein